MWTLYIYIFMLNGDSFECTLLFKKKMKSELLAPYYYIYKNILNLFLKKRYRFQISERSYKCGKQMESAAIVDILRSISLSVFVQGHVHKKW